MSDTDVKEYVTSSPVLFLIFNRPSETRVVFEAIRAAKPNRLYVAADGPRHTGSDDEKSCLAARFEATNVDWPCDLYTHFNERNRGARLAVSEGIEWFFSNEPEGIIIEDDIVPAAGFFRYMDLGLSTYRDDDRIGSIGGRNELGFWQAEDDKNGHILSSKFYCWGWASWRDRIRGFSVHTGYDGAAISRFRVENTMVEHLMLRIMSNSMRRRRIDSWAWPYDFEFRKRKQLSVLPTRNLVQNIGFGPGGTHTRAEMTDQVFLYDSPLVPFVSRQSIRPNSKFLKEICKRKYGSYLRMIISAYFPFLRLPIKLHSILKRVSRL